ncbi:MAG TPA: serine--tRNA ligase [Acetobacteraceae bacterium]|nr:serine--tRNA ligase [Acetobacteraceae bacterium]
MARRGLAPLADRLVALDEARRAAIAEAERVRSARNARSKEIGALKAQQRHEEAHRLIEEMAGADKASGEAVTAAEAALRAALEVLPNLLDAEVPEGRDETANVVQHQHGEPPRFAFEPRQHFELGLALGMDFDAAARLAGARFTVLRGPLARLHRALGQWMLDLHAGEHGYTECDVPLLVNDATMYGTGQLPKFAEDLFRTTDGRWLIPTAEVPLTNLAAGSPMPEAALPLRLTALSPCFRSEAGSAGRDTRGMLRQHQFPKVELVSITAPAQSDAEHERMTRCAERVLTELGLIWRRVLLCSGDTGFGAARTYDLEVWLPGQGAWREISSCSNCRDFQARRMEARYRPAEGKGTGFVHTLNGSGVAVGRALIAVMETHQQADGSIRIPEPLRARMGGIEALSP